MLSIATSKSLDSSPSSLSLTHPPAILFDLMAQFDTGVSQEPLSGASLCKNEPIATKENKSETRWGSEQFEALASEIAWGVSRLKFSKTQMYLLTKEGQEMEILNRPWGVEVRISTGLYLKLEALKAKWKACSRTIR